MSISSNLFHDLDDVCWGKLAILVGALAIFWTGLGELISPAYYIAGLKIFAAASAAIGFITHGGKNTNQNEVLHELGSEIHPR